MGFFRWSAAIVATGCLACAPAAAPQSRFLYIGAGLAVKGYRVEPETGFLSPLHGSPFPRDSPGSLFVHPTGRFVYSFGAFGFEGHRVDPESGALTRIPGSPFSRLSQGRRLVFSPDGVAFATEGSRSWAIDWATGTPIERAVLGWEDKDEAAGIADLVFDRSFFYGFGPKGLYVGVKGIYGFPSDLARHKVSDPAGDPYCLALDPTRRLLLQCRSRREITASLIGENPRELAPTSFVLQTTGMISALRIDPLGRFLFVEEGSEEGGRFRLRGVAGITSLRISREPPYLTPASRFQAVNDFTTSGLNDQTAIDPTGRFLYYNNCYSPPSPSRLEVLEIMLDGSLRTIQTEMGVCTNGVALVSW